MLYLLCPVWYHRYCHERKHRVSQHVAWCLKSRYFGALCCAPRYSTAICSTCKKILQIKVAGGICLVRNHFSFVEVAFIKKFEGFIFIWKLSCCSLERGWWWPSKWASQRRGLHLPCGLCTSSFQAVIKEQLQESHGRCEYAVYVQGMSHEASESLNIAKATYFWYKIQWTSGDKRRKQE